MAIPRHTGYIEWPDSRAAEAGMHAQALLEHPGWAALLEAIGSRMDALEEGLTYSKPREAAEYASWLGEMRGLRNIEEIASGIVENGKQAEARMRAREEGQ